MNADRQTFLTQTAPRSTDIRYYISREKAKITGEYPICRGSEIPGNNRISAGDESSVNLAGDRSCRRLSRLILSSEKLLHQGAKSGDFIPQFTVLLF